MRQQWEFHQEVAPADPGLIEGVCKLAGEEGWELRGCMPCTIQQEDLPVLGNGGRIIKQGGKKQVAGVILMFQRPLVSQNPQGERCLTDLEALRRHQAGLRPCRDTEGED